MFDTASYIDSLDMFGIRLGLAATEQLMEKAGHPEKNLRFIHIAGTNGKGSTGAMIERSLRNAGLSTGFYTSPHL
ncbi:MAG: bifunctional folylpolyglutamate synthase/dihydrofolate synthase, partial [Lentisphaeria bacterium]|nr:bifunctional folylpolyglutamate synthase/dihydrofolate synthase [Lentisphaeria bacterium]